MSNLIPEKRLDKNGILTTRHVRATPVESAVKVLPSPQLTVPAQSKPVPKLTPKQKKQKTVSAPFNYQAVDAELTDRISGTYYGSSVEVDYGFDASDAEFYDVHSIASYPNTCLLLNYGVKSKDEALELLSKLHLDRLVEDHSALSEKALVQRVPLESYIELIRNYPHAVESDPQSLADAAEIFSIKSFRRASDAMLGDLFEDLLSGKIAAEDMKVFGPSKFSSSLAPKAITDALADIKSGTVEHDAKQLSEFLDRVQTEISFSDALPLVRKYGIKFVDGMQSQWKSQRISELIEDREIEQQKKVLQYNNELDLLRDWTEFIFTMEETVDLYDAKIPPEKAVRQHDGGMSVQQIIGATDDGVSGTVGTGWL